MWFLFPLSLIIPDLPRTCLAQAVVDKTDRNRTIALSTSDTESLSPSGRPTPLALRLQLLNYLTFISKWRRLGLHISSKVWAMLSMKARKVRRQRPNTESHQKALWRNVSLRFITVCYTNVYQLTYGHVPDSTALHSAFSVFRGIYSTSREALEYTTTRLQRAGSSRDTRISSKAKRRSVRSSSLTLRAKGRRTQPGTGLCKYL